MRVSQAFPDFLFSEIRECFNVYSQDGVVHSAPQLRCILRSLGYSPTASKTVEYFKKAKKPMDFATFLEIAKEEHNSGDEITEIIKALKGRCRWHGSPPEAHRVHLKVNRHHFTPANNYLQDGVVHSAPQLRCILRSLGYSPTASKTVEYFKKASRCRWHGSPSEAHRVHLKVNRHYFTPGNNYLIFTNKRLKVDLVGVLPRLCSKLVMAGNFWQSSHYDQWIFEKQELLRMRSEDLKIYTEEEYQKLMIFWANLIQTLAVEGIQQGHPKTRMQVIATAIVYFKRFYARRSYKDVDPLLIACASVFLASKVEEHGLMSMSNLIKTIPNCLKKWPNLTYDASSKNSGLYDAEFILVEMLDCCLVVYHPYRPLTTMLQDIARDPTVKDFPPFEEQCWKVFPYCFIKFNLFLLIYFPIPQTKVKNFHLCDRILLRKSTAVL
ncbi:hypothetical protein OESDEN_11088 [Oesophagostomum dentatum]|uniref:Cyclin N-terminal domain-containing protein n=2 Tax=Strongyloidea TaxID=27829 RepID=A0A0B1T100_OESDE|nr:hypothetical protein OESDEN_11088 [Oesophagostomum dentatum]